MWSQRVKATEQLDILEGDKNSTRVSITIELINLCKKNKNFSNVHNDRSFKQLVPLFPLRLFLKRMQKLTFIHIRVFFLKTIGSDVKFVLKCIGTKLKSPADEQNILMSLVTQSEVSKVQTEESFRNPNNFF